MDPKQIAGKLEDRKDALDRWYDERAAGVRLPVTTSVDIRNAGFKIAVIDTNVFPAGFNNLCKTFSEKAAEAFKKYLRRYAPKTKKILIIPESFTRNIPYFLHLRALQKLVALAGFETVVGYIGKDLPTSPFNARLPEEETITLVKVEKNGKRVAAGAFEPDLLLLSNDCSEGIPNILQNLSQPIFPSPELGWHNRSKKHHFEIYCQLVTEMGTILETDCWHFCPVTRCERDIDVNNPEDLKRLAAQVDAVLKKTSEKYKQYGIVEKPYAFVKSNAGTFGLGLTHVTSGEEILNINRKRRKKLESGKGGKQTSEFLIQEGVLTVDDLNGAPIEPVLYFTGGEPIGGFFRIHEKKDSFASLNAPGARFESLCFHKIEDHKPEELHLHWKDHHDFFKIARWLGKIATLAVGLEEKSLFASTPPC